MTGIGTQATQNRAHRNDLIWHKAKGKSFVVDGQEYISEYNAANGWAIRKHFGTGLKDGQWYIFNAAGERIAKAPTLTWAKADVEAMHAEAFEADFQAMEVTA